jgi:hypothetical protein
MCCVYSVSVQCGGNVGCLDRRVDRGVIARMRNCIGVLSLENRQAAVRGAVQCCTAHVHFTCQHTPAAVSSCSDGLCDDSNQPRHMPSIAASAVGS